MPSKSSKTPLALRFVRWLVAVSVFITLAGIVLAVYLEYREDERIAEQQITGITALIPTLTTSLWRLDDSQINLMLNGISQLPAVHCAVIKVNDEIEYLAPDNLDDNVSTFDITHPLIHEADGIVHNLGELGVRIDRSYATERLPMRFLEIASIQAVRGVLIVGIVLWIFSHLVGRRLSKLSSDIRGMNWDNLKTRPIDTEPEKRDEISDVRYMLEEMRVRVVDDIERKNQAEAALEYQRLFDINTGLPNRTQLKERLAVFSLDESNYPYAIVAIELMKLSELDNSLDNDSLSFALNEAVMLLSQLIEPGGIIARYSERRLILIVAQVSDRNTLDAVLTQVSDIFDRSYLLPSNQKVFFSAAQGICEVRSINEDRDAADSIAQALRALDEAVSRGHGSRSFWGGRIQEEVSIYQQVRSALQNNAYRLCYQPIFELNSRRVVAIECLIRWQLDGLSEHGVETSIRMLEQNGLGMTLDKSVLQSALKAWQQFSGVFSGRFAINMTANSFADPGLADHLAALPAAFREILDIELTETNVLGDLESAQQNAMLINESNIRLCLDDFGTGFASIEYLSHFQFHTIKIDRTFFRKGVRNQMRLLKSMVSIAHRVGSKVVAEGIEEQWQLDMARQLKVDYVQGFLLCKPMPDDQLLTYLQDVDCG